MEEKRQPEVVPVSIPGHLKPRQSVLRFMRLIGSGKITTENALQRPMRRLGRAVMSERRNCKRFNRNAIRTQKKDNTEYITKSSSKWQLSEREEIRKASIDRQSIILDVLCTSAMYSSGKRIRATHLAAALVMEHGLGKENLIPWLNAADRINRKNPTIYDGAVTHISNTVNSDLLVKVNETLLTTGKAMTSSEMTESLGFLKTEKNMAKITAATAVLDLIGLTLKLPKDAARGYKWIHRAYAFSSETIPNWNLDWKVLKVLRGESHKAHEIAESMHPMNHKIITASLLRMNHALLVSVKTARRGLSAELTGYAADLLRRQKECGHLPEELRIGLLGTARQPEELTPVQSRILDRIFRAASVLRELECVREEMRNKGMQVDGKKYFGVHEVAKRIVEPLAYVISVAQCKYPWSTISERNMEEVYLPHMNNQDRKLTVWLKKWLSAQKELKTSIPIPPNTPTGAQINTPLNALQDKIEGPSEQASG